ncbi:5-(carboxyamino)imidazole ribonucleotide synthase [Lactiplantibacillus mudanjiangensis]|uniref:N5-carboxyaminoimidazole ribonucleotide synthase n=1 Tax=Lactiplantibacillus mudanjiangensis TaxID=1296538 RepID=A0A660DW75_9LACO|nr:5-(carboxyamino)imidazole ribonucleotide synthase [Lactiplantibacillus mudanjiangensis]VDG18865.1 5-(carboxyamino)imidazole ribonucleotide synthase [Lactobacillus plantarum] [Lactiplantibacillus mudanjiangensis]VDG25356.1 5-(carboxyamino)imidazole ribonucleotide synthase [Lactobacillus plantarum] [Lactiplantibacillus mudanjiangensis]VDG27616.1 5-(carboxyamino)imidazole ribonucleotide synthase [Lactobacillus plantarum] [Lactiplantibacillus mudanjiangensis]VDG32964.1 5-(carboxyamino)imidazole 
MNVTSKQPILPPATIGIVGGGQLGQMLALSAKSMGYHVGILDPTPQAPAAQVADFQITAPYDDQSALIDLAKRSDVLTYEFENVDEAALIAAQQYAALPQGTALLHITGNRLNEKQFLHDNGIPVTEFAAVTDEQSLIYAMQRVGTPAILKTAAGGYDGHGQTDLMTTLPSEAALALLDQPCILEARQTFRLEVSMMVTRSATGVVTTFPLVENRHKNHILHTTIAPATVGPAVHAAAQQIAVSIANALSLRGVLGIEFFVLPDDRLLVNELAPRPHNSGHYTIEACNISQFEAHIRSICGLPIPPITQLKPAVMRNLLGADLTVARDQLVAHPEWHFHDYGKAEIKPQRKMGHITIVTDELNQSLHMMDLLKGAQ